MTYFPITTFSFLSCFLSPKFSFGFPGKTPKTLFLDSRENFPISDPIPKRSMMKISGILAAASAAAASAAAISSPTLSSTSVPNSKSERSYDKAVSSKGRVNPSAASDKYAPRFDGLRFIETLVTAHR